MSWISRSLIVAGLGFCAVFFWYHAAARRVTASPPMDVSAEDHGASDVDVQGGEAGPVRNVTPSGVTTPTDLLGPPRRFPLPREIAKSADVHRFNRVAVMNAGQFESGGRTIRLLGVTAPARGQTCTSATGQDWPCGTRAAAALSALIRARAVDCEVRDGSKDEGLATCRVGKTDLATWVLRHGWARPSEGAAESYSGAYESAKSEKLGLWSDGPSDLAIPVNP